MIKKLITFLTVLCILTIALTGCNSNKNDDYSYKTKNGLPIADIVLAYLYSGEPRLGTDIEKVKKDLFLTENQIIYKQVPDFSLIDAIVDDLSAEGCNVIITDESIPADSLTQTVINNDKKYFIIYGDTVSTYSNAIYYKNSEVEYCFMLGALASKISKTKSIGILNNVSSVDIDFYAKVNAFAAGVNMILPDHKVVLSKSYDTLLGDNCDIIFATSSENAPEAERLVGIELGITGAKIDLISDYSMFLEDVINKLSSGFVDKKQIDVGLEYSLYDESFDSLIGDENVKAEFMLVKNYFKNGNRLFTNYAPIMSNGEVVLIHSPLTDNLGNEMTDENGKYYYYDFDENGEMFLTESISHDSLVKYDMNFFIENISIK